MSWALMKHPDGIEGNLFITHAWQEGIFEFISKVLNSWPYGANAAWCCMLANPQNLDIAQLINSPPESPFAKALRVSKYLLVVPNRVDSIYCRLWCAYEAFLAYEWDIDILTATAPIFWDAVVDMIIAIFVALAGAILAVATPSWERAINYNDRQVMLIFLIACLSFYFFTESFVTRRMCSLSAVFICAYLSVAVDGTYGILGGHALPIRNTRAILLILGTAAMIFNLTRTMAVECARGAEQLRAGYGGSITHARCTRTSDETQIRAEIGDDRVGAVNHAIDVLLCAGMSTPSLRRAAQAGVNVQSAAHIEYGSIAAMVMINISMNWDILSRSCEYVDIALSFLSLLELLMFLVQFFWWAHDARAFATKVCARLGLEFIIFLYLPLRVLHAKGMITLILCYRLTVVMYITAGGFIIVLSALHVDGVSRYVYKGRAIAQCLVAPRYQSCFRCSAVAATAAFSKPDQSGHH